MYAILIRIVLRYLSGFLVAKGLLSPGFYDLVSNDPELGTVIELALGGLAAVLAEGFYYLARRFRWAK